MTIVLVAFGSSFIALSVFLLGKATDPTITGKIWWYNGAFISIALSLFVYSWALRRERKRERTLEQERKIRGQRETEREDRETAREQRERERHEHYKLMYGETFHSNKDNQ